MAYPFVKSATDLGIAKGPRLAIVWHMAEGGGTVAYLAKPNPNGVSVHFVIERTGRIVQMLDVTHMHSSLRVSDIRLTDDGDGFYGRTHALTVMGDWADVSHGTNGPNHASLAVEMEGFAAVGPNDDQIASMAVLWRDVSTRYPKMRSLAHRDFQDYKACPGRQIPWNVVGGHGVAEDDMAVTLVKGEDWKAKNGILRAEPDTGSATLVTLPAGSVIRSIAEVSSPGSAYSWRLTEYSGRPAYFVYKRLADGAIPDWEPIASPGVDAALTAFIDRSPNPDCAPAVAAEYDRVTQGTTLSFPPKL